MADSGQQQQSATRDKYFIPAVASMGAFVVIVAACFYFLGWCFNRKRMDAYYQEKAAATRPQVRTMNAPPVPPTWPQNGQGQAMYNVPPTVMSDTSSKRQSKIYRKSGISAKSAPVGSPPTSPRATGGDPTRRMSGSQHAPTPPGVAGIGAHARQPSYPSQSRRTSAIPQTPASYYPPVGTNYATSNGSYAAYAQYPSSQPNQGYHSTSVPPSPAPIPVPPPHNPSAYSAGTAGSDLSYLTDPVYANFGTQGTPAAPPPGTAWHPYTSSNPPMSYAPSGQSQQQERPTSQSWYQPNPQTPAYDPYSPDNEPQYARAPDQWGPGGAPSPGRKSSTSKPPSRRVANA